MKREPLTIEISDTFLSSSATFMSEKNSVRFAWSLLITLNHFIQSPEITIFHEMIDTDFNSKATRLPLNLDLLLLSLLPGFDFQMDTDWWNFNKIQESSSLRDFQKLVRIYKLYSLPMKNFIFVWYLNIQYISMRASQVTSHDYESHCVNN